MWVTIRVVTPRLDRESKVFLSAISPSVSRFASGSSRIISAGSPYKARARATRWRCPADRLAPPAAMDVL